MKHNNTTGQDSDDFHAWNEAGINDPMEASAWRKAGVSPDAAGKLRRFRFDVEGYLAWKNAFGDLHWDLVEAEEFSEAVDGWIAADIDDPNEAKDWMVALGDIANIVPRDQLNGYAKYAKEIKEWKAAGFSAEEACRAIAQDLSIEEALSEKNRATEDNEEAPDA